MQEELKAEIAEVFKQLTGNDKLSSLQFEALEVAIRTEVMRLAVRRLEAQLNEDKSDHQGDAKTCPCGQTAAYQGRRKKNFVTSLGEITLERAYYYCAACGHGFYPRDQQMGLPEGFLSPTVQRMVAFSAASLSFHESSAIIQELTGLSITAKEVGRVAERIGAEIAKDEAERIVPKKNVKETMYLGMDGTGIPMRKAALKGRAGKQAGGSSKTREVKVVTVWTADSRDKDGHAVRDKGSLSYNAAIESAAYGDEDDLLPPFAQRVARETSRTGFDSAKRQVIIGDGAKWIWNLAYTLYPGAIQIIDLYHAKGTITDAAKAIWGESNPYTEIKGKEWRDALEEGKLRELIRDITLHGEALKDKNTGKITVVEYLEKNTERLRYPYFRRLGLCVSSGVVEAGCKYTIGFRLKQAGMHWGLEGANQIIALRCCKQSNRFNSFWERRSVAASSSQMEQEVG